MLNIGCNQLPGALSGLREVISNFFPNASFRPADPKERSLHLRISPPNQPDDAWGLPYRRAGMMSEFNDCPAIPSSPADIRQIESFTSIVRLSPILQNEVDQFLAINNNELWPALSELAVNFLRSRAKVENDTLFLITIINA